MKNCLGSCDHFAQLEICFQVISGWNCKLRLLVIACALMGSHFAGYETFQYGSCWPRPLSSLLWFPAPAFSWSTLSVGGLFRDVLYLLWLNFWAQKSGLLSSQFEESLLAATGRACFAESRRTPGDVVVIFLLSWFVPCFSDLPIVWNSPWHRCWIRRLCF